MEAQRADVISAGQVLKLLRVAILGVLLLGITGTVIELLLLEHDEADKPLQFVPLILIAAGVAAIIWELARPGLASLTTLAVVMVLYVLSSFVGFLAHFYGSAEFVLDLNPEAGTLEILEKALHAKAPPLLAPGMMMQLGLLGLAYVYSDSSYRARALRLLKAAENARGWLVEWQPLGRSLVTFCAGVAATLAWLSYGGTVREMIASSSPQLSWLAPPVAPVGEAPGLAPPAAPVAEASAALSPGQEELKALSAHLADVRQRVDEIAAQLAAGQEQVKRDNNKLQEDINKLQEVEQDILAKISAPPPRPAAAPARKSVPGH